MSQQAKSETPRSQGKQSQKEDYMISSFCESSSCVGVKKLTDGQVAIKNTSHPGAKPIVFSKSEWVAFTKGVKNNEFDV